jgi:hypothetical protein
MVDCKGDSRLVRRFADRVIERMRMTRGRGVNRGAVGTRMRLNSKRTGPDRTRMRRGDASGETLVLCTQMPRV